VLLFKVEEVKLKVSVKSDRRIVYLHIQQQILKVAKI